MAITNFESRVLNSIPVGVENRVSVLFLSRKLKASERDIKGAISELRKQRIPVGTSRSRGGVYIARSIAELAEPIKNLKSQAGSMMSTAKLLEDADFDWDKKLDRK